jgi:hypothetical protein
VSSTISWQIPHSQHQAHHNPDNGEDPNWKFGTKLTIEHVWDAFMLLSLLKDHEEQGRVLKLPHTRKLKDRFMKEMADHNERIICEGQSEIAHCCEMCMCYRGPGGELYLLERAIASMAYTSPIQFFLYTSSTKK